MRRSLFLFLSFLVFVASAFAEEAPIVRIEIEPRVVSVGEPVALTITVLAPTWFPKPPVYPSFDLANAMTRLPPDSSYPISERVGTETWSGITRSYEIYPLIAASYQLDAKTVTVTWADPDTRSPITRDVELPAVAFRAVVPPGAEGLDPYLAGRALTITRDIDGEVEELWVGDAIVVRYTAELTGLAAVFLPPMFPKPYAEGAKVYAKAPLVEDGHEGEPSRRVETLTFVLETSGELALPGVELDWWNTTTNTLETASVPALSLPVSGTLLSVVQPGSTGGNILAGLLLLGLAAAGVTARRWLPLVRSRWLEARETRLRSESHAFGELRRSLRAGEARAVHHALLKWLERLQPGLDIRVFANEHGDSALEEGVENVIASLYADPNEPFVRNDLGRGLAEARKHLLSSRAAAARSGLPPLNP